MGFTLMKNREVVKGVFILAMTAILKVNVGPVNSLKIGSKMTKIAYVKKTIQMIWNLDVIRANLDNFIMRGSVNVK